MSFLRTDSRLAASDSVLQDVIVGHVPVDGNAIDLEVKGLESSVVCEPSSSNVRSSSLRGQQQQQQQPTAHLHLDTHRTDTLTHTKTHKYTDTQTRRFADTQIRRHTDPQTHRHAYSQTHIQTDKHRQTQTCAAPLSAQ